MANRPTVLIDGNGSFNTEIEDHLKLAADSRPIAALSIIGVQSTGKSTLLNRCFGTNFKEMDVKKGMNQTTKGIWVAKCPSPNASHEILVIDTEGSDGSERQDDVKFEKQVALFGLAISNTVIINMKCESVNLNNGASRPLLRIVFEVMIRKFTDPHKVNLVFVLRDKNEAPLDKLREQLMDGLNKIWKEMAEPKARVNATLGDYFTIEVVPLSHYKYQNSQFKNEVASLKERIISSITTSAEFSRTGIAASGFAKYAQKIWSEIEKENDLDLPSYKDMVDEVIYNRFAEEKYQSFCKDKSWLQIKEDVKCKITVQGFGEKVSSLINTYLIRYGEDAPHNNETKRDGIRKQLIEKLLLVVQPTYLSVVEKMSREILKEFEVAAMVELMETGELDASKTIKFIHEFQTKLEDAAIKQANWNHPTKQLNHLKSEIELLKDEVRTKAQQLKQYNDMADEVNCNRIAEEKYQSFCKDKSWLQIKEDAESCKTALQGFGKKVSALITKYLILYDEDAPHNNETKRDGSRKQLTEKLLQVVEPTYLSVVEKMSHEILKKFEVAAMDELKKTGDLVALETTKFIDEFQMNLQDAAIEQANWNHPNQQLTHLKSEIAWFEEGVRTTNQLLKQHKKDEQSFWAKFEPVATAALSIAIGVAIQSLLPGIGVVGPKVMQIMVTLLAKNPKIAGQLLPEVASIL